jgi:putative protease
MTAKKTVKKAKKKVARPRKKAAVKKVAKKEKSNLEVIGEITHYFPHVSAGVIKLARDLKTGDKVQIKGHTTDFKETVDSIQIDHVPVTEAKKGQEIGLKVKGRVRIGDTVYKVK